MEQSVKDIPYLLDSNATPILKRTQFLYSEIRVVSIGFVSDRKMRAISGCVFLEIMCTLVIE